MILIRLLLLIVTIFTIGTVLLGVNLWLLITRSLRGFKAPPPVEPPPFEPPPVEPTGAAPGGKVIEGEYEVLED
jgi:hypothetical protein